MGARRSFADGVDFVFEAGSRMRVRVTVSERACPSVSKSVKYPV